MKKVIVIIVINALYRATIKLVSWCALRIVNWKSLYVYITFDIINFGCDVVNVDCSIVELAWASEKDCSRCKENERTRYKKKN